MNRERIDYDSYFFEICKVVAKRSTCLHRQVGALLVKNNRILTTGYNGAPSGYQHCNEVGCSKPDHAKNYEICRAIHAEMNCILQAALHGISIQGAILYSTTEPCILCKLHLNALGIKEYHYIEKY